MPTRLLRLLALCVALAGSAGVPAAYAQSDPFGPVAPAPQPQPAPEPVPAPDEDDGGLNRTQELLIGGAGIVLLFGIGWAIVRDARSAAPVESDRPGVDDERGKGSRRPKARRVSQSRAKAKAARRARKKNR